MIFLVLAIRSLRYFEGLVLLLLVNKVMLRWFHGCLRLLLRSCSPLFHWWSLGTLLFRWSGLHGSNLLSFLKVKSHILSLDHTGIFEQFIDPVTDGCSSHGFSTDLHSLQTRILNKSVTEFLPNSQVHLIRVVFLDSLKYCFRVIHYLLTIAPLSFLFTKDQQHHRKSLPNSYSRFR